MRSTIARFCISFATLCLVLVLAEAGLRFVFPSPNKYYIWNPNLDWNFKPSPDVIPGVTGLSRFITNSDGIRADERTSRDTYRILALGGSTTECLFLDQEEAWPQLLQKGLNEGQNKEKVWVGNIGRSGLNTRDHVVQLRHFLGQESDIDALIILPGINDLSLRLGQDSEYDPDFLKREDSEAKVLKRAFSRVKDDSKPFYKRTVIWNLLRGLRRGDEPKVRNAQDDDGRMYISWREHRRNAARIRQTLPDLESAIGEYSENLGTIIDLAQRRSIRVILLTQPVLWKHEMDEELERLLWFGGVGNFLEESGKEYYSAAALSSAIDRYNETLMATCRSRQVECVDIAARLPKDTSVFYDDVHFNESGARKISDILVEYLTHSTFPEN